MSKLTKYLGIIAAGSTVAYLVMASKEKNLDINHINGLNLEINPDLIIDSAKHFIKMNPESREIGATVLKKALNSFINK